MKGPTPLRLKKYAGQQLGLGGYWMSPGDGRSRPEIGAEDLVWAQVAGNVMREGRNQAIEALVCSGARKSMGVRRGFGDDALAYFNERLDASVTRTALVTALRRAKRNKAFENSRFVGIAVDGTGAGWSRKKRCELCRPIRDSKDEVVGYGHRMSAVSVVGTGITLPVDVEPYRVGESEYGASQKALRRAVAGLGKRFADYVVADGAYATAPFLHTAGELGLRVVARVKANLPELHAAVEKRFKDQPPTVVFEDGGDRVEIWDADDFLPWEALHWNLVRVIRYRQTKPDGTAVNADWLTDFPTPLVGSRALYRICKSRWEIENQVFNEGKNQYGLEHTTHHETNSVIVRWLLLCLALVIERLYRIRNLHRGRQPILSAVQLLRILRLSLSAEAFSNTS